MPGNAGISFGFDVATPAGRQDEPIVERLVIRVPPAGVRQQGNTDVLRKVPLLQALAAEGVPVPAVRWWGADEQWFGVPYLVVECLPGRSLNIFAPDRSSFDLSAAGVRSLFSQAVDALVATHRVDWRTRLAGWDGPRNSTTGSSLYEEASGQPVRDVAWYRRSPDSAWPLSHP